MAAAPGAITTAALSNGTHSLTATATDAAGNTGVASTALSVTVVVAHALCAFDGASAGLACTYTGREITRAAAHLVLVTSREPDDTLYDELLGTDGETDGSRIIRIGDCRQPAIIAAAVHSGHKAARELGGQLHAVPAARERIVIAGPRRH